MVNTITKLDNGLRLVHKKIDGVRSVAICVMTRVGSVNETAVNNGISHFIEHMLFKGTEKRTSFEIVKDIAGLGAQVNAFTSKEATCYYIVTVDEYVEQCVEILSDLYFNSTFDKEEMEREKSVVLEEIAMSIDTPDDLCLENLNTAFYDGHPLGQQILGPAENIKKFTVDDINEYMSKMYRADNSVVCMVGNIDQGRAEELTNKYFKDNFNVNAHTDIELPKTSFNSKSVIVNKDLEQSHIALDFRGFGYGHRLDMASMVLNAVLGSGMSSRLFQEVREKLGLAYSVYSYNSAFSCGGDTCIYLGTNLNTAKKAVEVVKNELIKLKKDSLTADEIELGKRQLKGNYVLSQEGSSTIMRIASRTALMQNKPFDLDERIAKINSVTAEDIRECIDYTFDFDKMTTSYVGKKADFDPLEIMKG